jgi:hypothetical protein
MIYNNVAAVTSLGLPDGYNGYGGGLYLNDADGAIISNNVIISNTASQAMGGKGGGLRIADSHFTLQANQILSNTATSVNTSSASGGGLSIRYAKASIYDNIFMGNWANAYGGGYGAGFYQWYDIGETFIMFNQFTGNHGWETIYMGYSQAHFASNQVVNNQTDTGIFLFNNDGTRGARFENNIIALSGGVPFEASGHVNYPLNADLIHNTLVGDGTGYGVYIDSPYVTLYLTNTIIANNIWGITNTIPASSTAVVDHTLFWENTQNGIEGANPFYGDPDFIDPYGDFHIGLFSAAIDIALTTSVIKDLDGNDRIIGAGPDIGADEFFFSSTRSQEMLTTLAFSAF